ncbi:CaiB/BaiF CoA transferase family protein [Variovorax paradoxus]|uniref:Formyl-coenzyme A transferase n=1 Tax=Variovorax paradoxus TaxID=34073 RepID=A0A0H2LUM8_VARPD|nr:CoA transferase [Variovorax paradoxus]KLN53943.1 formyl-coenzyme A transferase [Variovorax paradoxus]
MQLKMKVVSFCHYLQGPACTQYLADMGAEVVKIEPLAGAFERHWSGGNSWINGVSAFLMSANRNTESLAIDLKQPEGRDLVLRLIDEADVVIENFRPGVLDRLGLGFDMLRERKPALVLASASGLGRTGPAASRPGQDLLMQARSGLIAATGGGTQGPAAVGAAVIDQHGGALLAMGILGACVRRLQTGEGTLVESSLFAAGIDLQTEALTKYYAVKQRPDVFTRDRHVGSWYHDAPYGVYPLAEGHLVLSMNDPAKLAAALDSDALRALQQIDRYAERDRYAQAVAAELRTRRFEDVSPVFDAHAIWHERVRSYDDLLEDPQARHNEAFREIDVPGGGTALLVNHPLRYDGELPGYRRMPFHAGQDSLAILQRLGLSEAECRALADAKVIGMPGATAPRS